MANNQPQNPQFLPPNTKVPQPPGEKTASFSMTHRLQSAKLHEFSLIQKFEHGYRNREDITTLIPGIMVVGSENVLTNTFQRVGPRKGYVLDGQRTGNDLGVSSSFDWERHTGDTRNLRAAFQASATDGKLQYRYVANAGDIWNGHTFTQGQVYWIDLMSSLDSIAFNFCDFWDFNHELKDLLLFVNGKSEINMWSGALATFKSASNAGGAVAVINTTPTAGGTNYTVNDILTITTGGTGATVKVVSIGALGAVTAVSLVSPGSGYTTGVGKATSGGTGTLCTIEITTITTGYIQINGTKTPSQLGFLDTTTYVKKVAINTNIYTYSYVIGFYLVGISADATAEPVQSVIQQDVVVTQNSLITSLPPLFKNNLIANLNNQIYLGGINDQSVYVSKVNEFLTFAFSASRKNGEGAQLTLDGVPTAFISQQQAMWITAGQDFWYETSFNASTDSSGTETLSVQRLKTTVLQASQTQAATAKIKNNIVYLSFEPIINIFGTLANILNDPQVTDISFPIVNDMNAYDFTNASLFFFRKYIYVAVPAMGLVLIYNMTDEKKPYWEAPQRLPISRFAIINGELYGHSSHSCDTFQLFTGTNDDGHAMRATIRFSFENLGVRALLKSSNAFFIEGYIATNTTLTAGLLRDLNGSPVSFTIRGSDSQIVQQPMSNSSLGKISLGKNPLGGSTVPITVPKFRVIKTYNRVPYFEEQPFFESSGTDQQWELVACGTNATPTSELPNFIKQ